MMYQHCKHIILSFIQVLITNSFENDFLCFCLLNSFLGFFLNVINIWSLKGWNIIKKH